jgi:DNA-binding transcriptional regulator YiaG
VRPAELEIVARTRAGLSSGEAGRVRAGAGVSAAEVARVVGVSPESVRYWERGLRTPDAPHALAYGRLLAHLGAALLIVLLAACTSAATSSFPPSSVTGAVGGASVAPVTATPELVSPLASAPEPLKVHDPKKITGTLEGRHCQFRGSEPNVLPDASCTPGAYDPGLTAAVLCAPGYTTRSYRPPVYQTARFELEQALPAYGLANIPGSASELDHLIPLTLGGANDASNLWPELGPVPNRKDATEVRLHKWVCQVKGAQAEGRLAGARQAVAADWLTAEQVLGVSGS